MYAMRLFLLLLCCSLLALRASDQSLRCIPIGKAWAGHQVGFALLTHGNRQFVAYYDEERRITVAGRELDSSTWTFVRPEGRPLVKAKRLSSVTGWDSHNYLTLAIDRDGCLHLSGNMHCDPLLYWRTSRPLDIASFERIDRMTGDRELSCTYPVFFEDKAGNLIFRYRDGGSGNGSDLYNRYDPATRSWSRLIDTPLHDGEGQRNAYAMAPTIGPDGRFHLVWMWRDTPDCSTNHTLSYARSADLIHWEDHAGRPIALPITLARGDIVDAAKPKEGLINMSFNFGFDDAQRPVIVYHRYDAKGRSQAFVARPDGAGWSQRTISEWSFRWQFQGNGSIPSEVKLGAPVLSEGKLLLVPFSTQKAGSGRWKLRCSDLSVVSELSAEPSLLPGLLLKPFDKFPGLQVRTQINRTDHATYVLRWETLPPNRDNPPRLAPPPADLRLYEMVNAP